MHPPLFAVSVVLAAVFIHDFRMMDSMASHISQMKEPWMIREGRDALMRDAREGAETIWEGRQLSGTLPEIGNLTKLQALYSSAHGL